MFSWNLRKFKSVKGFVIKHPKIAFPLDFNLYIGLTHMTAQFCYFIQNNYVVCQYKLFLKLITITESTNWCSLNKFIIKKIVIHTYIQVSENRYALIL